METKKPRRGLLCSIFRDADGTCCTNGPSKTATEVLLIDIPSGPFDTDSAERLSCPIFYLHENKNARTRTGAPYLYAAPIEGETIGTYMFGGNFLYSSDGRFPNDYPIPIHDRMEG